MSSSCHGLATLKESLSVVKKVFESGSRTLSAGLLETMEGTVLVQQAFERSKSGVVIRFVKLAHKEADC